MANATPASTVQSEQASIEASCLCSSSSPSATQTAKPGRPNQWSPSRQRKLARLYLYSILPPNDIRQALEEKDHKWKPGKESTTKTVNNLLDKDPRWLRPKNREEMDLRIAGLADCTKERKHLQNLRKFSQKSHKSQADVDLTETVGKSSPQTIDTFGVIDDIAIGMVEEFDMSSSTEWSETPLQDLFASAPEELLSAVLDPSSASFYHSQHTFRGSESTFSPQEPSVLDFNTSMLGYKDPLAAFLQSPPTDAAKHVKSISTEFSTSSMKRRLSHYSDGYLQNIVRLLEGFSISDGSVASKTHLPSPSLTEADDTSTGYASTVRPSSVTATSSRSSGDGRGTITLPSAFLFLDRYIRRQGVCLPGLRSHDSGTCWCLEDLDPNSPLWVNRTGMVNHRISDPPESLKHLDIRFRDIFGNTVLHMLAARGADIEVIFKALKQGADPNAKNSAGQTFAHLFTRKFLQTLAADRMVLMYVLRKLATFQFRFLDCDLFGRNFFHVLTLEASDVHPNALKSLKWINIRDRAARDAFGWSSAIDPTTQANHTAPFQRTYTMSQLAKYPHLCREVNINHNFPDVAQNQPQEADMPAPTDPNHLIFKHARLLETAGLAIDVPDIEDTVGRNGLQCLAEASLTLGEEPEVLEPNHKRKRDQSEPDPSKTKLTFRYELVQKMVHVGVDVNNYDKKGNTVLMAFVTHLQDGEDDKTLTQILQHLIQNGANVHWRNREGETALHIAVRLGRKVATRVLLMNSASVHARNAEGKGILAVGEVHYLRARLDPPLYASIMACMALCIRYGAVARPTSVQEWSLKEMKPN